MHLGQLALRNVVRSPFRMLMTVITVGVMLTAFMLPRTLVDAQEQALRDAPTNRVLTLPRRGWTGSLPLRYAEEIRSAPGIADAVGLMWAGFKLPAKENFFFASNAVEARPFIAMHFELVAPEAEKQAFVADDSSAIVSRDLAKELGWKVGDRVVFQHRQYPGDWAVTIACIYDAVGGEWAKRSLWVHYEFLNRALPLEQRDKLAFVSAKVAEPDQASRVAKELDRHFDAEAVPTTTMEDRVLTAVNVGRIGAVLAALDLVSYLILVVVLSILLNTLTLNVRERAHEFGVMRAIGFGPKHLYLLVLGEAAVLGLAGGLAGLAFSYPLLEGLVGPVLQERLQFQELEVPLRVSLSAVT